MVTTFGLPRRRNVTKFSFCFVSQRVTRVCYTNTKANYLVWWQKSNFLLSIFLLVCNEVCGLSSVLIGIHVSSSAPICILNITSSYLALHILHTMQYFLDLFLFLLFLPFSFISKKTHKRIQIKDTVENPEFVSETTTFLPLDGPCPGIGGTV